MTSIHHKYDRNTEGRDFVIGDLHGCYDELMDKLLDVNFNKVVDRVFSVGDLVDRGPASLECLRLTGEPWFHAVIGNHEDMMFNVLCYKHNPLLWLSNGGLWIDNMTDAELIEVERLCHALVETIPHMITVGKIGIVHAEPPLVWPGKEYTESTIWGRTIHGRGEPVYVSGVEKVYVGHTIVEQPVTLGDINFIDTGCFATGKLCFVQL
jgi:serine/threonine protein phosphatase 1